MGCKNHMTLQAYEGNSLSLTNVCYELGLLFLVFQLSFSTSFGLLINPPKNLSVYNVSTSSAVLTWERGSEDDIYYNVRYSEKYDNTLVKKRVFDNIVKIDRLKSNREYFVVVESATSKGVSVKSDRLEFQTLQLDDELPLLKLRVKGLSTDNITLTWDKPTTNKSIKGYTIYYSSKFGLPIVLWNKKDLTPKNRTATIDGLEPGTTYRFLILAFDAEEQGPLSYPLTVATRTFVPVSPPSNLRVVTVGSDMVTLGWDKPNVNTAISGYRVLYTSRPELPIVLWRSNDYTGNQQTATIDDLNYNETYYFVVLAYDNDGQGPLSSPLEVTIRPVDFDTEEQEPLSDPLTVVTAPILPPSNVRVVTIGSDMVTLEWDKSNVNTSILGYKVLYTSRPELPIVLWRSNDYTGNQQTATIDGLVHNETYNFVVLAYNDDGQGPLSSPLEVSIRTTAPRSKPSNLRSLRLGREWVTLEWDKPVVEDAIKGYKVYYTTRPESPFNVWNIELSNGTEEKVTINKLVFNETYTFRVAAFNEGGDGPLSLALQTKIVKHDKPRRVKTSAINSTAIFVEWRMPRNKHINGRVDGYHVYYEEIDQDNERVTGKRHKLTTEKTEMVITGLKHETTYMIQVVGYTIRSGEGMISDSKIEQTLGGLPSKPQNLSVSILYSDLLVANVSWKPPQYSFGPLNSYKLFWGHGMEPFQMVHVDNDTLSYVTPQLESGIMYHFGVHASNKNGYGDKVVIEIRTPENVHPTVLINPQDPMVSVGENVTFQCIAGGKPSPTIYWIEKDQSILMFPTNDYGRFSVTEDGSLFIQGVTDSDAGSYVCEALNSQGTSSASSVLKVIGTNVEKETMSPFQEKVLKLLQRNVDANERIAKELTKTYETVEQMAEWMNAQ